MEQMEKAGPLYQFVHHAIQEAIYDLIPKENVKLMHKNIYENLRKHAIGNPDVYLLMVDQINMCLDESIGSDECLQYSQDNATAAKFAIAASSLEQGKTSAIYVFN